MDGDRLRPRLMGLYQALLAEYGRQNWWPARHSFEMCVGAILVQNTAWVNARKALTNLARRGVESVAAAAALGEFELAELVRPSGYYNQKAAKIAVFCEHVLMNYGGDLSSFLSRPMEALRDELLGLWGIGEETADSIILYAAKQPTFVVDTYTVRALARLGVIPRSTSKSEVRQRIMAALPPDTRLYAEFHALLIQHGKRLCRSAPLCGECPLLGECGYGRETGIMGAKAAHRIVEPRDYWGER